MLLYRNKIILYTNELIIKINFSNTNNIHYLFINYIYVNNITLK